MEKDTISAGMLSEQWSNNACRGYVIWAMENCGFDADDIQRMVMELHEAFDFKTKVEAELHYRNSPY